MILVHICCSVDSHYFLQRLQEDYPDEKLVGFFYDPNIHPYSEYRLRYLDVEYSCKKLGIELLEGEYALEEWLALVKGLENEPEKGDRCTVCFDNRLEVSVKKAMQLGADKFTTTLLISPKKSQDKLDKIGNELSQKYGLQFIFKDYRSGRGVEFQGQEVKKNSLYRQNYCGCMFALNAQRDTQEKLADELISPVNSQVLPESIEERLDLYRYRNDHPDCEIIKQRFLNYRLLNAKTVIEKKAVPSYFLCYSTLKNKRTKTKVEKTINNIGYTNRDEVKVLDIGHFNSLCGTDYKDIMQLAYDPLRFEDELALRAKITNNSSYDLSCVIVLDEISDKNMEITCNAKVYDDVREAVVK